MGVPSFIAEKKQEYDDELESVCMSFDSIVCLVDCCKGPCQ